MKRPTLKILMLLMIVTPAILPAQKKSEESKNKIEILKYKEKSLIEQVTRIQDSIKIIQALIQAEQKTYEKALLVEDSEYNVDEAVSKLNTMIGSGIKLNTGKMMLSVIEENGYLTAIDKNEDFLLTSVDDFPIYFVLHKKVRYRVDIQNVDLSRTQIHSLNEELARHLKVPTYTTISNAQIEQQWRNVSSSSYSPSSSYERSPNHSQEVHTGPRGGKYVITASGEKRYVKKN